MRTGHKSLAAIFIITASLGIGACGNPSTNGDMTALNASSTRVSPLEEFMGQSVWNNEEKFRQAVRDLNFRREELIAQCMLGLGFEYAPDVYSNRYQVGSYRFDDETKLDDRHWVSQYGFGIVSGHRISQDNSRVGDDPNQTYIEALTDSEREAFFLALNGPPGIVPWDGMTEADFADLWRNRGCFGQALQQAREENPLFLRTVDEFAPLFEAISDMHNGISDDLRYKTLVRDWAYCMADRGHPGFDTPADPALTISDKYREIILWNIGDSERELQSLQAEEINLALADFDCRSDVHFATRLDDLLFSAETQFVLDHRAALEAYRAASEQR